MWLNWPTVTMPGLSLTSRPAAAAAAIGRAVRGQPVQRLVWRGDGRLHIAVRGVTQERNAALARAVEAELPRHPAVSWAVVNAPLGTVVIGCRAEAAPAELISVIEKLEREHSPQPETAADRPVPLDRVPGAVAALAANAAGLSLAGAGRAFRTVRLPAELGSLVSFVDTQPRLRGAVERAIGPGRADVTLAAANALAQSAAQGVSGLALDVGQRVARLAEAMMQRDAWARAEPQLCGDPARAAARPVTPERPCPLPPGPIERYSERIGLGAAGAFGGVLAVSRSPRRAASVALAGLPKAARLSREGFAATLGCLLARRGVVVMDQGVLRRLDRIDTVVVDADVLTTGALVVGDVVAVGGGDAAELVGVVHGLFAADRLGDISTDGTFTLGPLDALGLKRRAGFRAAAKLAQGGAASVLGLAQDGRLLAVVGVVLELADAADLILTAAGQAGLAFMVAAPVAGPVRRPGAAAHAGPGRAGPGRAGPGPVTVAAVAGDPLTALVTAHRAAFGDRLLPDGRRLVASIRGLQADGAGVLLVSRQRRALAAADCGVGLASADGLPAWGAHLLAGNDLAAVALIIEAVGVAHAVSDRGVNLAQAGTALGVALAFGGTAPGAAGRSLLAVNGAGAIALTSGAWSAAELARRPVAVPSPRIPWHAMPAAVVLERLQSGPDGLGSEDAHRRWHPDERQPPEPSLPRAFLAELANPLTPILAGGAALSASIGAVTDAVIVTGVGALSALIGGVQRVWTDRSMAQLFETSAVTARVLRDGREQTVPATRLVAGDIVVLGAGDVVPADCRLLEARSLQVDESSLTGESFPVDKTSAPVPAQAIADRRSMLYEGTAVAAGRATAVVVATGSATETGRSMAAATGAAPVTGVEARLAQITRTTLPLALGSAGAVMAAGLVRGRPARDSIGAAVGLAVASVPEGLPFLVSAAQLASARRLAARGALVRNPRTIEALGRVDVLCFDKTGTLTQGRMAVAAVSDGTASRRGGALDSARRQVLAAALRATPPPRPGRKAEHMTDAAVTAAAAAERISRASGYPRWRRLAALPFEPSRSYHATLGSTGTSRAGTSRAGTSRAGTSRAGTGRAPDGSTANGQAGGGSAGKDRTFNGPLLSVKGAPEVILPRCVRWRGRALGAPGRKQLNAQLDRLAGQGYRVLAVAENNVAAAGSRLTDGEVTELTFVGFMAFGDPVRTTAGASVRELREAGVHVVMITGDHPATAAAIATELDVLNGGDIVTGTELDKLDDDALCAALANASVIARSTPAQKVRVVQAFQRLGRTVAMTGDGANDAAAIALADVGIALGKRGTPAARAAADLVVGDDRLETILSAVVEGRAMWASVRQAIGILVGGNIGEIGYTLLGALLTGTSPLSARQLLLVNLLTDLAPALAVALRPPDPEAVGTLLAEGPEASLGSALTEEVAVRAVATTAGATAAWLAARMTGRRARARTIGLAALVGTELGQTLLVGGRSPTVAIAGLASAGVLVGIVQTPGLSQFFGCTPLGPVGWGIAVSSSVAATAGSLLLPSAGQHILPVIRSLGDSADAQQAVALLTGRSAKAPHSEGAEPERRRGPAQPLAKPALAERARTAAGAAREAARKGSPGTVTQRAASGSIPLRCGTAP
jgi:cation-transporting ATPase I